MLTVPGEFFPVQVGSTWTSVVDVSPYSVCLRGTYFSNNSCFNFYPYS